MVQVKLKKQLGYGGIIYGVGAIIEVDQETASRWASYDAVEIIAEAKNKKMPKAKIVKK